MWNSCGSVFPNTRAWEQQELDKKKTQRKKIRVRVIMERSTAGTNNISPVGISEARTSLPSPRGRSSPKQWMNSPSTTPWGALQFNMKVLVQRGCAIISATYLELCRATTGTALLSCGPVNQFLQFLCTLIIIEPSYWK